jgi:hypothetical protein
MRSHVAVSVDSSQKIVTSHSMTLKHGATQVRAPGEQPDISPDYYGAMVRDLDGHIIEVVHWSMQPQGTTMRMGFPHEGYHRSERPSSYLADTERGACFLARVEGAETR